MIGMQAERKQGREKDKRSEKGERNRRTDSELMESEGR